MSAEAIAARTGPAIALSDERIDAIVALGYTPREAAFLKLTAEHGGYFLRRQFLSFARQQPGRLVTDFTRRLLARGHASQHTFCRSTHVYHLAARAIYGHADNAGKRERRRRPAISIKPRLMALDFALARSDVVFLTTEQQRLAYCDALGVDRARLPQQRYRPVRAWGASTRYFIDVGPIGVVADPSQEAAMLFAYIDDGSVSVAAFQTYLNRYVRLLAAIPRWRLVYVAENPRQAVRGEAVFHRAYGHGLAGTVDAEPALVESVLEYFRLRDAYEAKRWHALNKAALDRFLDFRTRFSGRLEGLYAEWEIRGDSVVRRLFEGSGAGEATPFPGAFEPCLLPYSYVAMDPIRTRVRVTKTQT